MEGCDNDKCKHRHPSKLQGGMSRYATDEHRAMTLNWIRQKRLKLPAGIQLPTSKQRKRNDGRRSNRYRNDYEYQQPPNSWKPPQPAGWYYKGSRTKGKGSSYNKSGKGGKQKGMTKGNNFRYGGGKGYGKGQRQSGNSDRVYYVEYPYPPAPPQPPSSGGWVYMAGDSDAWAQQQWPQVDSKSSEDRS